MHVTDQRRLSAASAGSFASRSITAVNSSSRGRAPLAADAIERLRSRGAHWRLPESLLDELFGHHALLSFSRGDTIYAQGSPAEFVLLVQKGLVNLYAYQLEASRVLVRLAGHGELIGYTNTLDAKGRALHALEAISRTGCQLAMVTRERFANVLQSLDSRILVKLMESLNAAWSGEMLRWANSIPRDCRHRLELVFADLALRLGARDAHGIVILPELSHQDLAEMTGCSRPMASRVIGDMLKDGVLERQAGHYVVPAGSEIEAMLPDHAPARP
jgi:CRP-like cAMP-binding protein